MLNQKWLALLIFILCFFTPGAMALNEWTVVVYMVNDDDEAALENANMENLNAMASVGSGENYELIVQIDGRPKSGWLEKKDGLKSSGGTRWLINRGEVVNEGNLGEVNMGSPDCLWECLKWAHEKHPAKHYMLVFNSHGSGIFSWRGTGGTSSPTPGEVSAFLDPSPRPRFVAYDNTDNDCLTVFEITKVTGAFRDRLNGGRKIDIVGIDACLPSSIEALFQFRDVFDYVIGSPDTTPIQGFNYRGIATILAKNPSIESEAFALSCARALNSEKIGAWRTADAQDIAGQLSALSMQLKMAMKETGKSFSVSGMASYGGKERYWDLEKIAWAFKSRNCNLNGAKNMDMIQQLGGELLDSLTRARLTSFGGITVAWPMPEEYKKWRNFYKALDFSTATHWDELLDYRELGMK